MLALHDQDVSNREIACQFHVGRETILRILHRHHVLCDTRATARERQIILRMSKRHKTRAEICARLGRSRFFVGVWQRKLNCQRRRKLTKEGKDEICRAYRSSLGLLRTVKATGYGLPTVVRVLAERGVDRPRVVRFQPNTRQLIEAIDLAFGGNDSIASIARKIGGPYHAVRKLIHNIRRCTRFLPTRTLDSYLPMKHRESKIGPQAYEHQREEETMMYVLDCVRRACADCHLPPDPRRLIAVAVAVVSALYLREKRQARIGFTAAEEQKIVDSLSPRFMGALDTLLSAEQAVVH